MRLIQALLATLVALLLGFSPAAAQTYPKFTGLVVDAANVLPAATKADLEAKLEALQKDTKRQLVVATLPDLQGRELSEYGVGLGRAWGIGLKDVDNGAILMIAPNEPAGHRGPRLEVGYGLEPFLTDAFSGVMIREKMLPLLKKQPSDIPAAMEAGTDAVIAQLRASPEEQKANLDKAAASFDAVHKRSSARGGGIPFGLIFWGLVIGFVILSSLRRRGGGQQYHDGVGSAVLWGAMLGGLGGGDSRRDSGGGWGSGGSGGGGSDGSWGGGGFTGGGGGSFGGGGASGDW
nr:TPM domain-containing protein [Sphingomonas sp. PAMC 26605]